MGVLSRIASPADLRKVRQDQLPGLAREIRDTLVQTVSRTGGHLGPNLGVVELTIALHRVFDSPREPIVFDTGHQSYVHKLLTGRAERFDTLRTRGGLSGYPDRGESEHDVMSNSHASTSLSYADGLSRGFAVRGEPRTVVAVIGDGALTGGMAWEALNNIAESRRPVVVVVNDNGRSYTPTVGALARHLTTLRTHPRYEQALGAVRGVLGRTPLVGRPVFDALHGAKRGIKDVLAPQGMFEDLGLKYIGPVDGHDEAALERALRRAKGFGEPVLVHVVTHKGEGFELALAHEEDNYHSPKPFDPATGLARSTAAADWTSVFRQEMVRVGDARPDVVGITAAMMYPTGLDAFAALHPDRVVDVGIAEQHALTSAAGMSLAGLHPVVALYATFLNRAFDQLLLDVSLHHCAVTVVLDRAGVTGDDGPSHNGVWDLAISQVVPGLRVAAPRDGRRLRELFAEAVEVSDTPTLVRFPKGALPDEVEAVRSVGGVDVLVQAPAGESDVLLVGVGVMVGVCLDAAKRLRAQGIGVTVVDPRWVKPVPDAVAELARDHRLVVTVEDGVRTGGVGGAVAMRCADDGVAARVRVVGFPSVFPTHGGRALVLAEAGLTAQDVARDVAGWVSALESESRADSRSGGADTLGTD